MEYTVLTESEVKDIAKAAGNTADTYIQFVWNLPTSFFLRMKDIKKTETGFTYKGKDYTGILSFSVSGKHLYLTNNSTTFEQIKISYPMKDFDNFILVFSQCIGVEIPHSNPISEDTKKKNKIRKLEQNIKKYKNMLKQFETELTLLQ